MASGGYSGRVTPCITPWPVEHRGGAGGIPEALR